MRVIGASFTPAVRDLLASYNTAIALMLFTLLSKWGFLAAAYPKALNSPRLTTGNQVQTVITGSWISSRLV